MRWRGEGVIANPLSPPHPVTHGWNSFLFVCPLVGCWGGPAALPKPAPLRSRRGVGPDRHRLDFVGATMEPILLETSASRGRLSPPDDSLAFEALVARYGRRVFAMAYRVMGDRQDAEDQTQEVFLKIYRGIGALDDPAALPAWITQ